MERLKKAKFAMDAIRKYNSKVHGSAISRMYHYQVPKFNLPVQRLGFGFQMRRTSLHSSNLSFLLVNRCYRFYSAAREDAVSITNRCLRILISYCGLVLTGFGIYMIVFLALLKSGHGIVELKPYTNKAHFVLWSKSKERVLAEINDENEEAAKILPQMDPQSVRVNLIANNIFEAFQRKLDAYKGRPWKRNPRYAFINISGQEESHLDGINCEVFVTLDESAIDAFCTTAGKIFVSKYLLDSLETDAEIAFLLSREVGRVVARHKAGDWGELLLHLVPVLALFRRTIPYVLFGMFILLKLQKHYIKNETEADYIGLMLMASAGYDPRIAPRLYKSNRNINGKLSMKSLVHPAVDKRAQDLSLVMNVALALYKDSISRQRLKS